MAVWKDTQAPNLPKYIFTTLLIPFIFLTFFSVIWLHRYRVTLSRTIPVPFGELVQVKELPAFVSWRRRWACSRRRTPRRPSHRTNRPPVWARACWDPLLGNNPWGSPWQRNESPGYFLVWGSSRSHLGTHLRVLNTHHKLSALHKLSEKAFSLHSYEKLFFP